MKTQITRCALLLKAAYQIKPVSTGMVIVFFLLSLQSFSQSLDIISPTTNISYRLPNTDSLQNLEAVQGAVVTAELAAKALSTDAAGEKARLTDAENDFSQTQTKRNDYQAALDNYTKNGYDPYTADLNNYTQNVAQYDAALQTHNTATDASNALLPEQRNANTVANLNSEKAQLDSWKAKLETWKSSLDDAKAKLDAQREGLQQQKAQYVTFYQSAVERLKISRLKLKDILDELVLCSYYAEKCRARGMSKFNYTGSSATGYFGMPVYQGSIADLNTDLERLKHLSGMVWDSN